MTECHSVPSEGRKGPLEKVLNILSCPLRGALSSATRGKLPSATLDKPAGGGYDINGKRKAESERYIIPPPHFVVLPLSQGEKVDGVQITDNRWQRV